MKIIVDVMGGDNAPEETVKGVIMAAREYNAEYVMVGNRDDIERIAKAEQFDLGGIEIVHTDEVMTMEDDPLSVTRAKKNTSMALGLRMLAEGMGDAFVSTGNTGALFTGATLIVRKIRGLHRAGIGTVLPLKNPVLLLDCGANVTVSAEHLEQFAVIGSAYMRKMFGLEKPRVGLLNNGTEACKGTELQQTAHRLLYDNPDIHFVGNVEGSGVASDRCDVLVTDGFTGNILLKSIEGVGKFMLGKLKGVLYSSLLTKLAAAVIKKPLYGMKKDLDPSEQGGSPILGISKPVIKAHGSSDAKAFKNAIRQAIAFSQSGAIEELTIAISEYAARKRAARDGETQDPS